MIRRLIFLFMFLMLLSPAAMVLAQHPGAWWGGGTTITLSGTGYIFCSTVTNGACTAFTPVNTLAIGPGSSTPHDLSCFSTTDGVTLEDCGAKTLDNGTIGNLLFKQTATSVNNVITSIDAHAASTTITLYPGICPVIHNASQAAADVNNALPALAADLCFIAQVRTTQTNYWRLTAASAGTVCLDGTCAKNYVSFNSGQLAVANYYTCMVGATDTTLQWNCYSGKGTVVTN